MARDTKQTRAGIDSGKLPASSQFYSDSELDDRSSSLKARNSAVLTDMLAAHAAIPRRIIQTGKSVHQSVRTRAMVTSIRQLNPDFEYLFYDDDAVETFIDKEFPQYRDVFDNFLYRIQKFDFFRYLAVYRYGGFYFDLDVLLGSGLSQLLDYGCVFSFEGLSYSRYLRDQCQMDWEIGNYAFGAAPFHPFLEAIIENCVRAQKDPGWVKPMMRGIPRMSKEEFLVLYTSGPGLISRTLAERPDLARTVMILFPDNVCDTRNWNCFGNLGVHMMDASWRRTSGRIRRRIMLELEAWQLRRLIRESAQSGNTRSHIFSTTQP